MKYHRPFLPYLPLFIIIPLIFPLHWFGHWVFQASKGCAFPCGNDPGGSPGPENAQK
jgi:hypothetical protein